MIMSTIKASKQSHFKHETIIFDANIPGKPDSSNIKEIQVLSKQAYNKPCT